MGRNYLTSFNQAKIINECINNANKIISEQVKDYLLKMDDMKRVRVYSSEVKEKSHITIPQKYRMHK